MRVPSGGPWPRARPRSGGFAGAPFGFTPVLGAVDDGGCEGVADDVHAGSGHVDDEVHAEEQGDAFGGQADGVAGGDEDDDGGGGDTGHALGEDHQHADHEEQGGQGCVGAVGVGEEDQGGGLVEDGTVGVEGVAEGDDEGGRGAAEAERFELAHERGQHRFGAAGDEGDSGQPGDGLEEFDVADAVDRGDEREEHADDDGQARVDDRDEADEAAQVTEAVVGDVVGDEAEHTQRRDPDYVPDDLEHHRGDGLQDGGEGFGLLADRGHGDAHKEGEDDRAEQVALAECGEDVLREGVQDQFVEVDALAQAVQVLGVGPVDGGTLADARELGQAHGDQQDEGGDDLEVEDRLAGDPADLLDRLHAGDAQHDEREDQGQDHDLHHVQEHVPEDLHLLARGGHEGSDEGAEAYGDDRLDSDRHTETSPPEP